MKRQIVPDVISGEQALCCLASSAFVQEAADTMADRRIGAVIIMDEGTLKGILTERDLVFRVLAKGIDPKSTTIETVMTAEPQTIGPEDSAGAALDLMRNGRYRHLPVLNGNDLIGIVSIRDLYEAVSSGLEEDLKSAESFIYGDQYGGVTA